MIIFLEKRFIRVSKYVYVYFYLLIYFLILIEHTLQKKKMEEVKDAKKTCIKAKRKGNVPGPSTLLVVFLDDTSLEESCVLL